MKFIVGTAKSAGGAPERWKRSEVAQRPPNGGDEAWRRGPGSGDLRKPTSSPPAAPTRATPGWGAAAPVWRRNPSHQVSARARLCRSYLPDIRPLLRAKQSLCFGRLSGPYVVHAGLRAFHTPLNAAGTGSQGLRARSADGAAQIEVQAASSSAWPSWRIVGVERTHEREDEIRPLEYLNGPETRHSDCTPSGYPSVRRNYPKTIRIAPSQSVWAASQDYQHGSRPAQTAGDIERPRRSVTASALTGCGQDPQASADRPQPDPGTRHSGRMRRSYRDMTEYLRVKPTFSSAQRMVKLEPPNPPAFRAGSTAGKRAPCSGHVLLGVLQGKFRSRLRDRVIASPVFEPSTSEASRPCPPYRLCGRDGRIVLSAARIVTSFMR